MIIIEHPVTAVSVYGGIETTYWPHQLHQQIRMTECFMLSFNARYFNFMKDWLEAFITYIRYYAKIRLIGSSDWGPRSASRFNLHIGLYALVS